MIRRREDGAAAVEMALVTGLLLLIALGAFEYGMAFTNFFGLAASSREAARVGASIGQGDSADSHDADCRILEAAAASLNSTSNSDVVRVRIMEWDENTEAVDPTKVNSYRPFIFTGGNADDPALLRCTNWFEESHSWNEPDRSPAGGDRPWIAVDVEFAHSWRTGFLWWNGSVNWSNQNVMRIEPVNYG